MASLTDIVQYDGVNTCRLYARLLTMAHEDGVKFKLDSGYRSVRQQWKLWLLYKSRKGPIAAFPGTSTHNKKSWKQGLDVNAIDGGTQRFRSWAAKHGIIFDLTVSGEAWHLNARADYTHRILAMWRKRHR